MIVRYVGPVVVVDLFEPQVRSAQRGAVAFDGVPDADVVETHRAWRRMPCGDRGAGVGARCSGVVDHPLTESTQAGSASLDSSLFGSSTMPSSLGHCWR